jgi:hypothetical protein
MLTNLVNGMSVDITKNLENIVIGLAEDDVSVPSGIKVFLAFSIKGENLGFPFLRPISVKENKPREPLTVNGTNG